MSIVRHVNFNILPLLASGRSETEASLSNVCLFKRSNVFERTSLRYNRKSSDDEKSRDEKRASASNDDRAINAFKVEVQTARDLQF